ncbi:hypothetical protein M0804_000425 [Polistes exclamans]|nr:hypothetical protein M0804_000425 [Polistes exclamans]
MPFPCNGDHSALNRSLAGRHQQPPPPSPPPPSVRRETPHLHIHLHLHLHLQLVHLVVVSSRATLSALPFPYETINLTENE